MIRATIDAGAADATVKAAWGPASTDNAYGGIVFRKSDTTNYWVACYFGTEVYLVRHTNAGAMIVALGLLAWLAGQLWKRRRARTG